LSSPANPVFRVTSSSRVTVALAARRALGVTWRLLSTNNRDLGRAARMFPDVESCQAALRYLRSRLPSAVPVIAPSDRTRWAWRIVLAGEDIAVSSRSYYRRVHCGYACTVFLGLVPDVGVTDAPHVG
jgi:hypothetical protein